MAADVSSPKKYRCARENKSIWSLRKALASWQLWLGTGSAAFDLGAVGGADLGEQAGGGRCVFARRRMCCRCCCVTW